MVRACAAASPGPWRLRIVGTGGDAALEATLRAAAGELDVELVAGIDWESEAAVAGEVAGFDAGLSPLRDFDGGSFKTVQYLAAGAIPIAEAGGEAEHHVRLAMGEDAAVVEPGDAEAIAVWLRRLADPALRDRLAQRARAGAAQHFSQVVIAAQIDGVLREALASAQPR
jgi:glycosyltransferase involved in cell wall biosynthesis